MNYYVFQPQACCVLSDKSVFEGADSSRTIRKLVLTFQIFPTDDFVSAGGIYICSDAIAQMCSNLQLTGFEVADVEVEIDQQMLMIRNDLSWDSLLRRVGGGSK